MKGSGRYRNMHSTAVHTSGPVLRTNKIRKEVLSFKSENLILQLQASKYFWPCTDTGEHGIYSGKRCRSTKQTTLANQACKADDGSKYQCCHLRFD